MIRLTYMDHISPYGVALRNVGRIHSPVLDNVLKNINIIFIYPREIFYGRFY